jgi:hypothetical protein
VGLADLAGNPDGRHLRRRNMGIAPHPMSIIPNPTDRQAGHDAGLSGKSSLPPQETSDRQAYASGHLAGREQVEQETHRWQRARITHPG